MQSLETGGSGCIFGTEGSPVLIAVQKARGCMVPDEEETGGQNKAGSCRLC